MRDEISLTDRILSLMIFSTPRHLARTSSLSPSLSFLTVSLAVRFNTAVSVVQIWIPTRQNMLFGWNEATPSAPSAL
jgi:hypothetical protein